MIRRTQPDRHPAASPGRSRITAHIRSTVFFIAVALFLAACNQSDRSSAESAEAQVRAELSDLRMTLESGLQDTETRIDALNARIDEAGDEASAEWREMVASLEAESQQIATDLESLSNETAEDLESTREELNRKLDELEAGVTEARLTTIETRDDFESAVEEEIAQLDAKIQELESNAASVDDEMKDTYDSALNELREQRQNLDESWQRLQEMTADSYDELRSDVASAVAALDRKVSAAARDLKDSA